VVWCFLEVIGAIFYLAFIFERFLIPLYRDFGLPNNKKIPLSESLVVGMFGSMMPATLIMLCGFYCLLHSWMNAFAELTCFADRMFYKVYKHRQQKNASFISVTSLLVCISVGSVSI
jgi:sterol O-acyltransferase